MSDDTGRVTTVKALYSASEAFNEIRALRAENERLRKALEDIERNYDHEDDAHKYNNGACRVCIARDALRTEDGNNG